VTLRAAFFDFDGLLCDTEQAAHQSWQEFYQERGLLFPMTVWRAMEGRPDGATVAAADLVSRLGREVTADELNQRLARKHELCSRQPLRPGVAQILDAARDLRLAVVSSSSRQWVHGHLRRLGIRDRFSWVITGDDGVRPKPAPDLYLAALAAGGLPPDEVVAFEDSATGVRAAMAAGIRCVAVPSSVGDPASVGHADTVLRSLADFSFDAVRTS
jgi:HAD superfamily hydrolase (TIGR01509 family)